MVLVQGPQKKYFMRMIDKKSRVFNGRNSGFIGLTSWDSPVIFPDEFFNEFMLIQFEDYEFYIPTKYDEILTKIYGDYMKLPAERDRIPHHNYKAYKL